MPWPACKRYLSETGPFIEFRDGTHLCTGCLTPAERAKIAPTLSSFRVVAVPPRYR